jgi:hypothetical protein
VRFDDVTGRGHRVGLVVCPVQPDPPAFTAHAHCLVLTEPGDGMRSAVTVNQSSMLTSD